MSVVLGLLGNVFGKIGTISTGKSKAFGQAMDNTEKAMKAGDGGFLEKIVGGLNKLLQPIFQLFQPLQALFTVFTATMQATVMPTIARFFEILMSPEVINAIMLIAGAIASTLIPIFDNLANFIQAFVNSGILQLVVELFLFLADQFAIFFTAIQPFIDEFIALFMWFLEGFMQFTIMIMPIFMQIITLFMDLYINAFKWLFDLLVPLIPFYVMLFEAILMAFMDLVEALAPLIPVFMDIFNTVFEIFAHLVEELMPVITVIIELMALLVGGGLVILMNALTAIAPVIVAVVEIVAEALGWLAEVVEAFTPVTGGGEASFNLVPAAQEGALVAETGIAVLHKGEGVFTREVMGALTNVLTTINNNAATETNQRINNTTINATVLSDENAIILAREMNKQEFLVESE